MIAQDALGKATMDPAAHKTSMLRGIANWFFNRQSIPIWLILGLFSLAFWPTYVYWWERWTMYQSAFGYGYLVPPSVLFLIWCRRKQIAEAPKKGGHPLILVPILVAVLLQCAGLIARVSIVQSFAFFVLLMSVPYFVWGGVVYRHIWGALAYMATMLPWPPQIYGKLLLPAQEISTSIAVNMLHLTGAAPEVTNGTTVSTGGGYEFEVAAACSGLTIVFPVIAITIMTVMMIRAPWWKVVFLLAIAFPLSIFANAVRIWAIAMIGDRWGADLANSLHDPSGIAAVVFATIVLTLIMWAMKAMDYKPEYMPGGSSETPRSSPMKNGSAWKRLALVAAALIPAGVMAYTAATMRAKTVISEATLPATFGAWTSRSEPLTDAELNVLQSPAASQRIYTNALTGDTVQILLIQVENTQSAHDPRLCMNGTGFVEVETREEAASWAGGRVSHSVFQDQEESLDMYYWMSTSKGTVANMSVGLKWEGFVRALRGEPTQGIAVRLIGRPNLYRPSESASPTAIQALWSTLRAKTDFDRLLKGM